MAPRISAARFQLSYQQQALWLLAQLIPPAERGALNLCYQFSLRGKLEIGALQASVRRLAERHSLLETRIYEENGKIWQAGGETIELQVLDLRAAPDPLAEADAHAAREAQRGFDLDGKSLARFELLITGEESWRLLVNLHHVIADGRSIEILRRDLAAIYSAIVRSAESGLPPQPVSYNNFVATQLSRHSQDEFLADEDYWTGALSPEPPMLDLRPDYAMPEKRSFRGSQHTITADDNLIDACRRQSFRCHVPLSVFMLAGFVKLLFARSGQADILLGTSFSGRDHKPWRDGIGLYINTVPLRFRAETTLTNREFIRFAARQYVKAHDHQYYPMQLLLARLPRSRTTSRPALFPAAFNFQYTSHDLTEWAGLVESGFQRVYTPTTLFEIVLHITVNADEVSITVDYCTDLFSRDTITALIGDYTRVLRELCSDEVPFNQAAERLIGREGQRVSR